MNPTWENPIEDDDDEAAYDQSGYHGRDAIIFLIDATEDMFENSEDETPFVLSLKCARTSLSNKIISNNKDLQAIVYFGTDKSKNTQASADFKHIYIFHELGEPGAERILEIEELMAMDGSSFKDKYGHSKDFSIADALWTCGLIFTNCSYKIGHKRILLFTSTDSPHENNNQMQVLAKTKARDLFDNKIEIDLMHIQKTNGLFDVSRFYKDIVHSFDDEGYKLPDASEKFDDLLQRVRSKDHKKRTLSNLIFTLGEEVKIAVSIYKLVVPTPKPTAAKLSKDDNAELSSMAKTFLGDTGEVLLPSDIKKFQEYGGKKIYLTDEEVKQAKNIGDPGLLLMGFKSQKLLKINHHIRACLFAYPDEKTIEGSTRLFYALSLQCQKRGYAPVCRLILRRNDAPKFVALVPQEEHLDAHGTQTIPPGFHIIYLPFMEDIRNIVSEKKHNPSDDLVEKAKEIIKKLQFAYHPESFENPVLQKHWRNIEALALNREAPEEITDYTQFIDEERFCCPDCIDDNAQNIDDVPTKDIIEKRAGKLIDEFKALLCPGAEEANEKRQMGAFGSSAKRQRLDDSVVPVNLHQESMAGQLGRYKVNVLKEFCRRNGIKCGSKKADIMEAIKGYYH